MNSKTAKLLRRYAKYMGISEKKVFHVWKKSTPEQQDLYLLELKDLRQKQFNRQLPSRKTAGTIDLSTSHDKHHETV